MVDGDDLATEVVVTDVAVAGAATVVGGGVADAVGVGVVACVVVRGVPGSAATATVVAGAVAALVGVTVRPGAAASVDSGADAVTVYPPVPPAVAKLAGIERLQMLVEADSRVRLQRWLADFAYRIAVPWWIFAAAGSAAVLIAFLTVSFQSIKAALANPVKSLRSE